MDGTRNVVRSLAEDLYSKVNAVLAFYNGLFAGARLSAFRLFAMFPAILYLKPIAAIINT